MSQPCYGQFHVAEPYSNLTSLHLHDETVTLKEVDHETPIAVLDQSDLVTQGIHTSKFISGCRTDATALGSCTGNSVIEAAAALLSEAEFLAFCKHLINSSYATSPTSYSQAAALERAAIAFYYQCTHQTGNASEEWPPTDCGSSGPYLVSELERLGVIKGQKLAHGAENIVSLLQNGPIMMGSPWFYAWEEPDKAGFIDGNGSSTALREDINSGVAGGHETTLVAVEKLALLATGKVDIHKTVIRARNHWTRSWGDHGCYRVHLSTLGAIGCQSDFRQLVA